MQPALHHSFSSVDHGRFDASIFLSSAPETILDNATSLTLSRPSKEGTYYAFLVHRSVLSLPEGWEMIRQEEVDSGSTTQIISLAKAPSSVSSTTFSQSASGRFLGKLHCVYGGTPPYTETVVSGSLRDVTGWHSPNTLTPKGNGIALVAESSIFASSSGITRFWASSKQTTQAENVGTRLAIGWGRCFDNIDVEIKFHHSSDNNYINSIGIAITDGQPAPSSVFSHTPTIIEETYLGGPQGSLGVPLYTADASSYDFWANLGDGTFIQVPLPGDDVIIASDGLVTYPLPRRPSGLSYAVSIYGLYGTLSFEQALQGSFKRIIQLEDEESGLSYINLRYTNISWTDLLSLFNLLTNTSSGKIIDVRDTPAVLSPGYSPSVAEASGWTVVDS